MSAKEKGILTKGGGHIMAAGFSLNEDKIEDFKKFAGEYISKNIKDESLIPTINIEGIVDVSAVNVDIIKYIESLEPFGASNSEPKIMLTNALLSKADIVGSGHIRCIFTSMNGGYLKAMAFRAADNEMGKALLKGKGQCFNLVGLLRNNTWQNITTPQFIIDDAMRI